MVPKTQSAAPQDHQARQHAYEQVRAQLDTMPDLLKGKVAVRHIPQILIAPYQVKIFFSTGEWVIGGRNAINSIPTVRTFGDCAKDKPAVVIGHNVEVAKGVIMLAGGEHVNDQAINLSFRHFLDIRQVWQQQGVTFTGCVQRGQTRIGDAVVISTNAIIRSGVTVGTGAVIGAGAVVTKDVPPFAIVAGNPARIIRYRFNEKTIEDLLNIRWWDFKLAYLTRNIDELSQLHLPEIREKYRVLPPEVYELSTENRMVFRTLDGDDSGRIDFIGAEVAGKYIARAELPMLFQFFIDQFTNNPDQMTYFIKDIFALSGLMESH